MSFTPRYFPDFALLFSCRFLILIDAVSWEIPLEEGLFEWSREQLSVRPVEQSVLVVVDIESEILGWKWMKESCVCWSSHVLVATHLMLQVVQVFSWFIRERIPRQVRTVYSRTVLELCLFRLFFCGPFTIALWPLCLVSWFLHFALLLLMLFRMKEPTRNFIHWRCLRSCIESAVESNNKECLSLSFFHSFFRLHTQWLNER